MRLVNQVLNRRLFLNHNVPLLVEKKTVTQEYIISLKVSWHIYIYIKDLKLLLICTKEAIRIFFAP